MPPQRVNHVAPGARAEAVPRRLRVAVAAALAVLYLVGVTGRWWPTPDSAIYLGLGRSLVAGEGYRFNREPHTTFPPGLPVLLAGLRLAFGPGFWAPNLLMALCGLAAAAVACRALARLVDGRTAFLAAATAAMTYSFYLDSHRVLSDVPFTLVWWALIYAAARCLEGRRAWLAPAAALAAVAVTLRLGGVLLIGPLAAGMLFAPGAASPLPAGPAKRPRLAGRALAAGAVLAGAAAPAAWFYLAVARTAPEGARNYLRFTERLVQAAPLRHLEMLGRGLWRLPLSVAELLTSQEALWPLGLVLIALMAAGVGRLWRGRARPLTAVIVLYPLGMALLLGPNGVRPRYLLPICPLLIAAALAGLGRCAVQVAAWRRWRLRPAVGAWLAVGLAGLLCVLNLPRLARMAFYYGAAGHTPEYYRVIRSGRYDGLVRASELLRAHCPPRATVATDTDKAGMVHLLSERRVVRLRPGEGGAAAMLEQVRGAGDVAFVLLEAPAGGGGVWDEFRAALDGDGRWAAVRGAGMALYRRRPAATAPAASRPADGGGPP